MPAAPAALFLFAHQDDEYGVFHRIEECVRQGLRVVCVYFTDGATARIPSRQRNLESLAVLAQLGVRTEAIEFAGEQAGIGDARLPECLPAAGAWLQQRLARLGEIDSIHVPAWEGGHHDHDALHALAVLVAQEQGLLERVRQYSLYNGYLVPHPFFNALTPLAGNGPVERARIPWRARLRYLRLCLSYPSQKSTWIGLFPFVLRHYLLHGTQQLQPVSLARLEQAPHAGMPYYQRRGFYAWEAMRTRIAELRSAISR